MRRFVSTLSGIVLGLGSFVGIGNAANFSDKSIGISIDLDGELVEQPQHHRTRFFSTPDNSAAVFIKPVYDLSLYDMRKDLKDDGWRGDGIDLDVIDNEKTARIDHGRGIVVPVKGDMGEYKINGVFGAFSGYDGQHFLVLGAARPDYYNEWKQRIKAMFDSIRFIGIDYSEMITNWQNRLVGKSLVPQKPVARGRMVSQPINLCSNGTVANKRPANTQSTATAAQRRVWNGNAWVTVPVAPMPRSPARWHIAPISGTPTLVIQSGARPQQFKLEMEGDQLFVNERPYSITENALCQ
jgi:hypothetical protein